MVAAVRIAALLLLAAHGGRTVAAELAGATPEWPPCTLEDCSLCLSSQPPNEQNLTMLGPDLEYYAAPFRIGRMLAAWDSNAIFSTIMGILVRERLRITVEYAPCNDFVTCYLAVNNCVKWQSLQCDLIETAAEAAEAVRAGFKLWPDLMSDLMFVPETYQSTISPQTFAGTQMLFDERPGVGMGTSGYTVRDGLYLYPESVADAWGHDKLDLLWLGSLESPLSLKYLAAPQEIIAAGVSAELDGCTSDNEAVNVSMTEHIALGWSCKDSWWLNPTCAEKGSAWAAECVAMIDNAWSYGKPELERGVAASRAPVAKLLVGFGPWQSLVSEKSHMVLFTWWSPDSTFMTLHPRRVALLPELDAREAVLLKAAWRPALDASTPLSELVTNAHLDNGMMDGIMLQVASEVAAGGSGAQLYQKVACDWLRSNQATWTEWLPGVRSCTQGQFFSEASGSCERCPSGTHSTAFRNGTKFCKGCDVGRFAGKEGALSCDACPAGQYQSEDGRSVCMSCPEGSSQGLAGQTACASCPAGRAAASVGALACTACPPGTSAPSGAVECSLCQVGAFAATAGSGACAACPGQLTTVGRGAASAGECLCPDGTYRPADGDAGACSACPEGLQCLVGSDVGALGSLSVLPGYMTRALDPLRVYKCVSVMHCPGGALGACAPHRDADAVACGDCEPGTFERDADCVPCDKVPVLPIVLLVCGGAVALFFLGSLLASKGVKQKTRTHLVVIVMFGLAFSCLQTLCVINSLDVTWPEPLHGVFQALSALTFNLKVIRFSCMVKTSPIATFVARQSVPVVPVPIVAFALLLKKVVRPGTEVQVEFGNAVGALFSIFFISILLNCTVPLVCYPHPAGNGESVLANPSILCFQSADHRAMVAAGALSFLAIPLPFLAFSMYGIARYPHHAARAMPENVRWLRQFQFMFSRYRPEAYYYGLLLLVRNCLICFVPIVLKNSATQICVTCVVISAFNLAQQQINPWRSRLANVLDGFLNSAIIVILLCGAMVSSKRAQATSIALLGMLTISIAGLALIVGLATSFAWHLRAGPQYDLFICHHKADAQAQARLLKIKMRAAKRRVFLDSDDLLDLQGLFDIVSVKMRTLVVYLTRCTLTRPWCAGEITTAFAAGRQVVAVRTPNFEEPTPAELDDLQDYLDLTGCNLAEHGLTLVAVAAAFRRLLEDGTPQVTMQAEGLAGGRFQKMLVDLERAVNLQTIPATASGLLTDARSPKNDMFVVSVHPRSDEAWAAAATLASYILQDVLSAVSGGFANLADWGEDSGFVEAAVDGARAVVVILGPDTMQCLAQLHVMGAVMEAVEAAGVVREAAPAIIPVSLPGFEFPSADYYESVLPKVWGVPDPSIQGYLKAFFHHIGISFPTGASEQLLSAQSRQVLVRIPRTPRKTLGHRAMAGRRGAMWPSPSGGSDWSDQSKAPAARHIHSPSSAEALMEEEDQDPQWVEPQKSSESGMDGHETSTKSGDSLATKDLVLKALCRSAV